MVSSRPTTSLFSHPSVKPSNILIDAVSMSLLKGAVIDFATELIGSSFRILDNPQVSTLLYYSNGNSALNQVTRFQV